MVDDGEYKSTGRHCVQSKMGLPVRQVPWKAEKPAEQVLLFSTYLPFETQRLQAHREKYFELMAKIISEKADNHRPQHSAVYGGEKHWLKCLCHCNTPPLSHQCIHSNVKQP